MAKQLNLEQYYTLFDEALTYEKGHSFRAYVPRIMVELQKLGFRATLGFGKRFSCLFIHKTSEGYGKK